MNSEHQKSSETLLSLKNVSVEYGGVKALQNVDISFKQGEIVALMGPNGAGKSTILKAAFGLAPLVTGHIEWRGNKINPIPHEIVPLGISFVPQGKRVFTKLTVRENLELGGITLTSKKLVEERLQEVLDLFPALRAKLNQRSGELSGGQQQMVAIGRGLMTAPDILLLDEPSLGLAPKIVKEVFEQIKYINTKRNMAIVVVEHNLKSLLPIVDRAYVLDKGKIVKEGNADEIVNSNIFQQVFLGALA